VKLAALKGLLLRVSIEDERIETGEKSRRLAIRFDTSITLASVVRLIRQL
jgi:hypothetical protein